jgi:hypothetical protein
MASTEQVAASGCGDSRRRAMWVGLAIACTLAVGFPCWLSVVLHADFTDLANEPIAYRYFFIERVRTGEHMVLGVGYLVSALQQGVYSLMQGSTPAVFADLRAAINRFSHLTNGAIALLQCTVFVAAAVSRRLSAADRVIVFTVGFTLTFGFGFAGFDYALMPDYYHLNMVIAQMLLLMFLVNLKGIHEFPRSSWLSLNSLAAGVAVGNKISLLPFAVVALAPLLLSGGARVGRLTRRGLAMASIAIAGFGAVHLLAYNGRLSDVRAMIPAWLSFVANPGGEPGFWTSTFWSQLWDYNYGYIGILFLLLALTVAIALWMDQSRTPAGVALYLIVLAVAAFYVYAIFKRPAATTLFESSQWLTCLAAMQLALVLDVVWVRRIGTAGAALLGLLALGTFPGRDASAMVRHSAARASQKQQFFLRTLELARSRSMVVLFKDNSLHHEGFHELLLKGASDFPTWAITRGNSVIAKHAGSIEFRSEYEGRPPIGGAVDGDAVLVVFQAVGGEDALDRYPGAREFAARPDVREERWLLTGKAAVRPTVVGRIFSPEEQEAAVTPSESGSRSRASSTEAVAPHAGFVANASFARKLRTGGIADVVLKSSLARAQGRGSRLLGIAGRGARECTWLRRLPSRPNRSGFAVLRIGHAEASVPVPCRASAAADSSGSVYLRALS